LKSNFIANTIMTTWWRGKRERERDWGGGTNTLCWIMASAAPVLDDQPELVHSCPGTFQTLYSFESVMTFIEYTFYQNSPHM